MTGHAFRRPAVTFTDFFLIFLLSAQKSPTRRYRIIFLVLRNLIDENKKLCPAITFLTHEGTEEKNKKEKNRSSDSACAHSVSMAVLQLNTRICNVAD